MGLNIEELFRSTINSIRDPIMVSDAHGDIVLANDAARLMLDIVPGKYTINSEWRFELFKLDGFTKVPFEERVLVRALNGLASDDVPLVVQTADRRFHVKISGRPILDEQGRTAGGVVIYRDVTESSSATAALIASEQRARTIIETALDAFVGIGPGGTIIEWSPSAEAMLGWSREEAIGQNLRRLIVPARNWEENEGRLAQFLLEAESGTAGWRYFAPSLRRDGTEIITEISLTGLKQNGQVNISAFLRDVTKQREAEQQSLQAQKLESMGQLTGGIAHDFNNLLTVITGTIEILADGVKDDPRLSGIVNAIDEAAARGARLTASLLAFARKQPLMRENVQVCAQIRELCKLLEPTLGRNITIETELCQRRCVVSADPSQLSTALLNLALNARDAMPDGGRLRFRIRFMDEGSTNWGLNKDHLAIEVSDTGRGIPAEVRHKIFEPFFTTKPPGKGTGLGLSMVYGFAKQSGGNVEVHSEEGVGTTFTLYLPLATGGTNSLAVELDALSSAGGRETILCVDDDEAVRQNVTMLLETLGYHVVGAANAEEALELEKAGLQFDLLFTDIVMPGPINGLQLGASMQSRRPDLRVLFTSGFDNGTIVRHGRVVEDGSLIAKPYRGHELGRKIREVMSKRTGGSKRVMTRS